MSYSKISPFKIPDNQWVSLQLCQLFCWCKSGDSPWVSGQGKEDRITACGMWRWHGGGMRRWRGGIVGEGAGGTGGA